VHAGILSNSQKLPEFRPILQFATDGRAVGDGSRYALLFENRLTFRLLQRRQLQGGVLIVRRDASVAALSWA
jgi:hypothetical protein